MNLQHARSNYQVQQHGINVILLSGKDLSSANITFTDGLVII